MVSEPEQALRKQALGPDNEHISQDEQHDMCAAVHM